MYVQRKYKNNGVHLMIWIYEHKRINLNKPDPSRGYAPILGGITPTQSGL